jgi:ribosomal protein S18 acetylase RimI-like enzyme
VAISWETKRVAVTEARGSEGGNLPARDILRRITAQRAQRYTDVGPDLMPFGSARFRLDGARLLVAYASVAPDQANGAVERVASYTRLRGLRAIWTLMSEEPEDEALRVALRAQGFVLDERLILMARQGEMRVRVNPLVSVSPITAWPAMWAYARGSRQAFYNDPSPDDDLVTARARERWRQQDMGWYRYYAASLDNHIVGGLYVSMWEDVPTIMGVYTLDTVQRRGVATTAIAFAVHDLMQVGRNTYCLYVKDDNPAQRLYRALGFQTLAIEETYSLEPN